MNQRRSCFNHILNDPLFVYPHRFRCDAPRGARIFGRYSSDCERCCLQQCGCFKYTAFVMSRSNYQIYMNAGHSLTEMSRVLAFIDIGAWRNLVRANMLPPEWEDHLRAGPICDIRDANRRHIRDVGTTRLSIQIGTLLLQDDFLVCDRLATPYILGTPFLDQQVLSIQPPESWKQLTNVSHVPIVHHTLSRGMRQATRSQAINAGPEGKVRKYRAKVKLRVLRSAALQTGH